MGEEADKGNNTDQKEKESDKREGMGLWRQMPQGGQRDRRDKEEVSGFGRERARVFWWNSWGGNQSVVDSGMRRR